MRNPHFCAKGHARTPANTRVYGSGRVACLDCKRASDRDRTRPSKPRAPRRTPHPSAKRLEQLREGNRRWRARKTLEKRIQAPDGWEDEFGPVPLKVSDTVWVDRVVLQRRLNDEPVGRDLTPGEARALHLLSVLRKGFDAQVPVLESAV